MTQRPATDLKDLKGQFPEYTQRVLVIRTKAAQVIPFVLNRSQIIVQGIAQRQLEDTGRIRIIVLKARQEGVSTYVAGRNFRRVHLYRNQTCLVIADQKKRASALFDIYDLFNRHMPEGLRPATRYQARNVLWYDATRGKGGMNSKITVETAKDAAVGRATTIQALHASEFAFWEHPEEVWVSLAQAVPDQGSEIWIESTANGVGNTFHQMWESAKAGENGYVAIFLPWWVHDEYRVDLSPESKRDLLASLTPWEREAVEDGIELDGQIHHLTVEQIAWRRQTIRDKLQGDERAFRQEYPSTDREAFLVSGNCYFDEEVLVDYEKNAQHPKARGNIEKYRDAIMLFPAARGALRVWKKPEADAHYVVFADTATGRQVSAVERGASFELNESEGEKGGRDFSCADVLKVAEAERDAEGYVTGFKPCMEHVAQLHGRIVPEEFARQLKMLGYWYSCPGLEYKTTRAPALIGVERNHRSGETVVRILKEDYHYPRLFYYRTINNRTQKTTVQAGWVTTEASRAIMLDGLGQALREGTLKYHSADGIREMFTFIRDKEGRPGAQEGTHDDRVISIAGAIQMARVYRVPSGKPLPEWERADTPTGWQDYGEETWQSGS